KRPVYQAFKAVTGKITGVRAGGTLAGEDPQPNTARTGFFQGFNFAHADHGRKLSAVADDRIGRRRSAFDGASNHIGSQFTQANIGAAQNFSISWHSVLACRSA